MCENVAFEIEILVSLIFYKLTVKSCLFLSAISCERNEYLVYLSQTGMTSKSQA